MNIQTPRFSCIGINNLMMHFTPKFQGFYGFVILLLLNSLIHAEESSPGLELFQRWVDGKLPITEAVVYREISDSNGTIKNQDWLRFGYQGNTWYTQRLIPDTNRPTDLIPSPGNDLCGASYRHLWTISEKNLHIVEKVFASGSIPEKYGDFTRSFMRGALGLGIPFTEFGDVHWDGLSFTTKVVSKRDPRGVPIATNTLEGKLVLGANGLPSRAEYSRVDSFPGAIVTYEYDAIERGIPTVFTEKLTDSGQRIYRWRFVKIHIGSNNLTEIGGYVPSLFAASNAFARSNVSRRITLWTNALSYTFLNGKAIPAFTVTNPKRTGFLIFGALIIAVPIFLALLYKRSKK